MITNTQQEKARFFSGYYTQFRLLLPDGSKFYNIEVNWQDGGFLELTPLSEISEEDLIQVAKMSYRGEMYHVSEVGKRIIEYLLKDDCIFSNPYLNHAVYQYLQQRGYALPWYSAELNRVIEVEEQVSLGWMKLKGGEK